MAKTSSPLLRIFAYIKRYPRMAILQFTCAVVSTLLVTVFPNITKKIIDEVIPSKDLGALQNLIWLGLGAFFLRDLCESMRILANNTFEQKVIFDLRSDLYSKIQRLPLRWFDNKPTGDIMTRVIEDVTSVERVIIDGIETGLIAVLQMSVVIVFMWQMNPDLALVAMIPLPFLAVGSFGYSFSAKTRHRLVRDATSDMNSLLHDNLSGIRQIKAYAMETAEHERFNNTSSRLRKVTLVLMRWWAVYRPTMSFVSSLGFLLVLWFGVTSCIRDELSVGGLSAFLLLMNLLFEPVRSLSQLVQIISGSRAAGDRVFEIIDSVEEPQLDGGQKPAQTPGHVLFENVSFGYADDKVTINNVNLEAKPGQTIALVGATGAGKSTIIHLLTCFYPYDSGSITLDGVRVEDWDRKWLREKIGYVTQESFLFNGSVRDNLMLGKRDATEEEMWIVLEAANAKEFVERLSEKLDTNVGERGVKLSVGEKQRLSIARVLLKDPPVILLDEATASVDTETERQIQGALERLLEKRTSIIIAHRLSTVRHADCIYVMERGQVVESGTHDALLSTGGYYAKLCQSAYL